MDTPRTTNWDRLGAFAVTLLLAAFLFGSMSVLAASATAESDLNGKRNDDAVEVVGVSDDDDDDDNVRDRSGNTGSGNSGGASNSGSRSIGSNSGNTGTGTTRNTGVSRSVSNSSDRSANTATGTTRGTGASAGSVSNSS